MKHKKLTYSELKARSQSIESLKSERRTPVYAIIENVRSLYNVGSLFRTADALRIEKLLLTGYTGKPPRREIDKVALGAVESVQWEWYKESRIAIDEMKKQEITVIALEQTHESFDYTQFSYPFPCAIILGNEYDGIEQNTLDMCDEFVSIPMLGIKQSLNVATAFGVLGYEMLKQYQKSSGR